jgi:beta-N-acetylhexosaminidase
MQQPIGPVMLDLLGTELSSAEQDLLQHPLVGGVVLFTRNYASPQQLIQLCQAIRQVRSTPLLITVDHEGGRVQRFREGFTRLPSMGYIGKLYDNLPEKAIQLAKACGWIMAAELLAVGIDLSFAPVLDLDRGNNPVISDRAFHRQPAKVITLAQAVLHGMHVAGMASTGKHFPGHGAVKVDSHSDLPIDPRHLEQIMAEDLLPFIELIRLGIDAIMPAHIVFPAVDDKAVAFSKRWLQDILRQQCHFSGIIFSDDLNMKGAESAGNYPERARQALEAGCNMILICNNRPAALCILEHLPPNYFLSDEKFKMLQGKFSYSLDNLRSSQDWQDHIYSFQQAKV